MYSTPILLARHPISQCNSQYFKNSRWARCTRPVCKWSYKDLVCPLHVFYKVVTACLHNRLISDTMINSCHLVTKLQLFTVTLSNAAWVSLIRTAWDGKDVKHFLFVWCSKLLKYYKNASSCLFTWYLYGCILFDISTKPIQVHKTEQRLELTASNHSSPGNEHKTF